MRRLITIHHSRGRDTHNRACSNSSVLESPCWGPKVNVQVVVGLGGGIQGPSVDSWVSTPMGFWLWFAAVCR